MAKPNFKLWVVNLVPVGTRVDDPNNRGLYYFNWDQAKLNTTVSELKTLFDEVCKHVLSKFAACDVEAKDINHVSTNIKPGDLVIRLTTKSDSVIMKKYGSSAVNKDTSGATKDTGSGVCSEAWLEGAAGDPDVPQLVARLAFHELMHNKLDATNSKDIHASPDDGTGLAQSPVASGTSLSATNKKNMALALGSMIAQFTGSTIP
jgi:hypothetical protein